MKNYLTTESAPAGQGQGRGDMVSRSGNSSVQETKKDVCIDSRIFARIAVEAIDGMSASKQEKFCLMRQRLDK